jgi:hypothetical protein
VKKNHNIKYEEQSNSITRFNRFMQWSGQLSRAISISSTTTTEDPVTNIRGANRTVTPTTTQNTPARPSNTQSCNNYPEFCNRKYSNITEIAAHNSPFTRQNNAARNQEYPVLQQLNDGTRVLQGQAHMIMALYTTAIPLATFSTQAQ